VTLLVDTSGWSLALKRDVEVESPEVKGLREALAGGDVVVTTGLILQEPLQGFVGAKAGEQILARFSALPLILPIRDDHVAATSLRTLCRQAGAQVGTVDALVARLCVANDLVLLSTDQDFVHAARHCSLRLWSSSVSTPPG
jgi:predicted nucleic acid-binding protein